MKKHLLFGAIILSSVAFTQHHTCGFDAHNAKLNAGNPDRALTIHQKISLANDFSSESEGDRTVVIIPVVVHIVHAGDESNITDEQVWSGIDMLNEDFNRLNEDTIDTRNSGTAPFQPIAANCGIEFRLAKIDPQGNCTNGIERRYSPGASVNADDGAKHYSTGGLNAWDRNNYMNIWVVSSIASDGEGITLGYAEFPYWGGSSDYGVIIRHDAYGSTGTSSTGERTLTHEIGHCLGLFHTFQDGCHAADCGDNGDYCCDTPPESEAHWSCVTTLNSCADVPANDVYGFDAYDQWENFMSYAPCQNMFSQDQKDIMLFNLSDITFLANLTSAANAVGTGVNDPEVLCQAAFSAENTIICAGTSIQFFDESYFGVTGWDWDIDGGTPSTSVDENPVITFNTPGQYNVSLAVTDGLSTVSATTPAYITVLAVPGEGLPYVEGFENFTIFPDNEEFMIENPSAYGWDVTDDAHYEGEECLKLRNFAAPTGTVDVFTSGTIDLSSVPATEDMIFSFRYAYKKRSASNNEKLKFYVSKDCGQTWALRKNIQGNNLSEFYTNTQYTPQHDSEWVYVEVLNINADYYVSNFRYKFEFTNDNGNNIYIDNINLYPVSMTGIEEGETGDMSLSVYPNPSFDYVNISFTPADSDNCRITITNALGQLVANVFEGSASDPVHFEYSTAHLGSGIYFVNLETEGVRETIKFIKK